MGSLLWSGDPAKLLHLQNGSELPFTSAEAVGENVQVKLGSGTMVVPKSSLREPSLSYFFPPPVEPSPAGSAESTATTPLPLQRVIPMETEQWKVVDNESAQTVRFWMDTWKKEAPPVPEYPGSAQAFKTITETLELPTRVKDNPTMQVVYRVPVDASGKPLSSASQMVFCAPYPNTKSALGRKDEIFWSERVGFTAYSFNAKVSAADYENRQLCYYFAESGSFDVVWKAKEIIEKKYGLTPSKLLVVGMSGGGAMGQQLALHHPDRVAAVAIGCASRVTPLEPAGAKSPLPWLVVNTRGDDRNERTETFVEQMRAAGNKVLWAETQTVRAANDWHLLDGLGRDLMHAFLWENRPGGSDLPSSQSPVATVDQQRRPVIPFTNDKWYNASLRSVCLSLEPAFAN